MAELAESLCLYLADALTGYVELAAHFLKGAGTAVIHAVSEAQHLLLTGSEGVEDTEKGLLEHGG